MGDEMGPRGKVLVVEPGEGRFLGTSESGSGATFKAVAAETGGAVTAYESFRPAGDVGGPPRHFHPASDEVFLVLEGQYVFEIDGQPVSAPAGTFLFIPKGHVHAFRNEGGADGRMFTVIMPAGLEHYFAAIAALMPEDLTSEKRGEIGRRYGMETVGPPLSS